ncbi:MAG: Gfo/Idh/MocA family oxidoreductase [Planctomycetes bacterium]|nr:Gfo/Idh/MocA family oxidoreductase [Planctomycetota bacterium]
MNESYHRRNLLRVAAATTATWAIGREALASEVPAAKPMDKVRIGVVGIGGRGTVLLRVLLDLEGVEVKAVCDLIEERVVRAQNLVTAAGQAKPTGYARGETDFERLCETEELDLVLNATRPWKWHTPISVAAMKAGKHAATEVPAAETIDECWQLVETAEKTRRYCVILENCCYFRNVMLVHHMLRRGLFGELRHCEAGYQHYLGYDRATTARVWGEKVRTANAYPTHPIGPVAQWLDINRGNRFDYLVSMSADGTRGNRDADINTSLLRTVNGQTVTLYYDTRLPRPYDLIYRVQGTKGIYSGTLDQIYIEGRSPKRHAWEPLDAYYREFEHPLWKAWGERALSRGGHGGADFMTLYRLIKCLRTGAVPDLDVYDAATWSCLMELSEKSVATRSSPQDVPDFTKGRWKTTPPIGIIGV